MYPPSNRQDRLQPRKISNIQYDIRTGNMLSNVKTTTYIAKVESDLKVLAEALRELRIHIEHLEQMNSNDQ